MKKRGLIIGAIIILILSIFLVGINIYSSVSQSPDVSGLYISELSLQTNLPEETFSSELKSNMIIIKKDGTSHFAIYPLIPGLDIEKEYQLGQPDFKTDVKKISVYKKEMNGQMAYLADWSIPFYVFATSENESVQANLDIEEFLNGMHYSKKTVQGSKLHDGGIEALKMYIERYIPDLPENIKEDILETYRLEETKYSKPIKTEEEYMQYTGCISHMLDIIIEEWPWEIDKYTRLDILIDFNIALVDKYGYGGMSQVDSLEDNIPDEMLESSKDSCYDLPVSEKFKS